MEVFRERLKSLREKQGKSAKVVSELCGLSPNAVNRYERGEMCPNAIVLAKLADYFDVSMDYLFGRCDKK